MSARRRRPDEAAWTLGNVTPALFDTGGADQGALFAPEPGDVAHPARAARSRGCITCGSETVHGDRCARCEQLGAEALQLDHEETPCPRHS